MSWRSLQSTDASAPSLTGQAGSLLTLLDAVLVNGYGSKSPLGWSIAYTGTNKRVYRSGAAARCQIYLRVVDDGTVPTHGAKEATWIAGLTASDVDTVGSQFGYGSYIRKSTSADATTRFWHVVGDDRTFILINLSGDSTYQHYGVYAGEIFSFIANDAYQAALAGRDTGGGSGGAFLTQSATTSNGGDGCSGMPGSHLGAGAVNMHRIEPAWSIALPNDSEGGYYLAPRTLQSYVSSRNQIRGVERGIWRLQGSAGITSGDTLSGVGALAGKTFTLYQCGSTSVIYALETSDTVPAS